MRTSNLFFLIKNKKSRQKVIFSMSRERGEREKQSCIKCTSMYLRIFVKKKFFKID